MGYSSDALLDRYSPYADRFAAGSRVLDLGCGRGEFLQLLKLRGAAGLGVDADEEMVAAVREKGLNAQQGQVHEFLEQHPEEFDGIFASHLIEHLRPEQFADLARLAVRSLRPGGRLILVTPNPHNLSMQLYEFWIDLQHVRFYSPEIVRWVVHEAGLKDIEVGENARYRSEPRADSYEAVFATPIPPVRLRSKLKKRLVDWLLPVWLFQMRDIVRSLYPPAEFYVTGIR
jgi:O-antigen chain-terminating methyltransferase